MKIREKSLILSLLMLLSIAILMLTSCKKDDEPEEQDQPLGLMISPESLESTMNSYNSVYC